MKKRLKIDIKSFITTPYGATIFPIFLLFISFFLPPEVYEYYVKEPNYMFMNFSMFSFVLLCVLYYYIGVFIFRFKPILNLDPLSKVQIPPAFIKFIALINILLCFLYLFLIFYYLSQYLQISPIDIVKGKGQYIKDYLGSAVIIPYGLGGLPNLSLGLQIFVCYYYYYAFYLGINTLTKYFYVSSAVFIITSILSVNRPVLFIYLISWFLIYTFFKNRVGLIKNLTGLFLVIIVLFIIISLIREGKINLTFLLDRLSGYTIAAYNRLALILSGDLSYVKAGIPANFYLLPVLKIPLTDLVFHDIREYSRISLETVGSAGLNSSYNMATLFGGIYQAVGIATPLYFFFLGVIGSRLYIAFKRRHPFGILFYPLFYASVAFWMIDVNMFFFFFSHFIISYIAFAVILILYKIIASLTNKRVELK